MALNTEQHDARPQVDSLRLPCPTWIFSKESNVHVARDREWFGDDYLPLHSFLYSIYDEERVAGVGTVVLDVKLPSGGEGKLTLKNVLHAPEATCNIIGAPIKDTYRVRITSDTQDGDTGTVTDSQGTEVALFEPAKGTVGLPQLVLSNPPAGETPFVDDQHHAPVSLFWHEEEREGLAKRRASIASGRETTREYTAEEGGFIKERFGGVRQFLDKYDLDDYNYEDYMEARRLITSLMAE